MPRIVFEHRVERPSRFPVLVPAGLPAQRSELEPDVVQIQLAEEEQRRFVAGSRSERRADHVLASADVRQEFGDESRARLAAFERIFLVGTPFQQCLELKEQRGTAQLIGRRIFSVWRAECERQRGSRLITSVVEEALRVGKCQALERKRGACGGRLGRPGDLRACNPTGAQRDHDHTAKSLHTSPLGRPLAGLAALEYGSIDRRSAVPAGT